jgi:hypothetical protein
MPISHFQPAVGASDLPASLPKGFPRLRALLLRLHTDVSVTL